MAFASASAELMAAPFGLDHGERPTVTVAEDVVGLGLVREDVLEAHGVRIQHVPALVLELGVDLDA